MNTYFKENIIREQRLKIWIQDKMLNPHPFPYKYHHMIQEKIKHRRVNKKKKIAFPKDLLKSKKYQVRLFIINMAKLYLMLFRYQSGPTVIYFN